MNFFGLFLLSLALYVTWGLFNGDEVVVSETVHIEIQQNLSKEIIQIITDSNPLAYNIEVSKFLTETLDDKNIEIHFEFKFEEKGVEEEFRVTKQGKILLLKIKEIEGVQYWRAKEVFLEGQHIEFKEGLVFSENEAK